MRIGVTGHQARDGIDWSWVRNTVRMELSKIAGLKQGLSSLAAGSDQVFADAALSLGIPVLAIIPLAGYERYFKGDDLASYRRLLHQCHVIKLKWRGEDEQAFLEAGKKIVTMSNIVFAIWDAKKAEGKGGTGDIVTYAQKRGKPVLHIDPIARSVKRI